jgi:hypothetical protein
MFFCLKNSMKLFCQQGDGLLDKSHVEVLRRNGMAMPQRHHDDLAAGGANNAATTRSHERGL